MQHISDVDLDNYYAGIYERRFMEDFEDEELGENDDD